MRNTVLLDIDGVIVDFSSTFLKVLEDVTGRRHLVEEITDFDFTKCVCTAGEAALVWASITAQEGLVYALPTYPGALAFLKDLREIADVVACTAPASSSWAAERYERLKNWGFDDEDIVLTKAKHRVYGDILIDDSVANCIRWSAAWGSFAFTLPSRPWNASSIYNTLDTYEEILAFVSDC